ncbi:tyrosine-protein phosphatase [Streptomyces rubradiris]|uniref:tyrosine-protein phosphatase n=1 Tax=Streptomyces rubradiris TaxID=285531 RepID=UPI0033F756F6
MDIPRRTFLGAAAAVAVTAGTAVAAAPPAASASSPSIRHFPLHGAANLRDLGGYPTQCGRQVGYGRVYRSDALNKLTPDDLVTLDGLGLRTVLDYRIPLEVESDGADILPSSLTCTSHSITDSGLYAYTKDAIACADPVRQRQLLGDGKAAEFLTGVYRAFVTVAGNRARFAEVLRVIASGDGLPLLYHCTSGKDRTGWAAYLILLALGVPEATAREDYLASNTFRAAADARTREGLKAAGMMENPDLLIPLQEVRAEYLDAALAEVEKGYGSLRGYFADGLGLDSRTVDGLRERMLL